MNLITQQQQMASEVRQNNDQTNDYTMTENEMTNDRKLTRKNLAN